MRLLFSTIDSTRVRRALKEINAVSEEMLTDNHAVTLVKKLKMLRRLSEGNLIYKHREEGRK